MRPTRERSGFLGDGFTSQCRVNFLIETNSETPLLDPDDLAKNITNPANGRLQFRAMVQQLVTIDHHSSGGQIANSPLPQFPIVK